MCGQGFSVYYLANFRLDYSFKVFKRLSLNVIESVEIKKRSLAILREGICNLIEVIQLH